MNLIYLLVLSTVLLLQSPQSVQSISLSRLCGQFGHTCFGANWGKRATPPENLALNLKENEHELLIDDDQMSNYVLDELRLELFRKRLRQLFQLD